MFFNSAEPRFALYSSLISHFRNFRTETTIRCKKYPKINQKSLKIHRKSIKKYVQKTASKTVPINHPKSQKMDPQRAPKLSKRAPQIHTNHKQRCHERGCKKIEKTRKRTMRKSASSTEANPPKNIIRATPPTHQSFHGRSNCLPLKF